MDLKLASRVRGIDAILGGHTHDGVPAPVVVGGTLVTNAGSNGKFLGVLDLKVSGSGVGLSIPPSAGISRISFPPTPTWPPTSKERGCLMSQDCEKHLL